MSAPSASAPISKPSSAGPPVMMSLPLLPSKCSTSLPGNGAFGEPLSESLWREPISASTSGRMLSRSITEVPVSVRPSLATPSLVMITPAVATS